ncbi:MAG: SnoaL-like polyketide cyclase [Nostoc sp.]|uniref:SnoaL-like polyketide cyclase n=1 Tax=Nostoc sp. TaxID=1180 RepID=UPI002FF811BC
MSSEKTTELPLWVQDRDIVITHDEEVQWREGKRPDYSYTNEFLHQESKFQHPEGSLEAMSTTGCAYAQNLVRTFEMEASNKSNPQQWLSIVTDKFKMSTNGGQEYTAQEVAQQGTYNLFLGESEHYSSETETFESSFEVFHNAFHNGFLWELTEVLSGPPNVTFKWRHWGTFNGSYKDYAPTGETVEIVGVSIARVTDDLKIESLEHYFDNNVFLQKLTAGGCPFHSQNQNSH